MSSLSIPNAIANGTSADGNAVDANFDAVQAWADTHAIEKAGGTMVGALFLSGAPTVDLHASTKKYVDDTVAVVGGRGSASGTTDSNGRLSVTHGLGYTPSGVIAMVVGSSPASCQLSSVNASTLSLRFLTAAGAVHASAAVSCHWVAWP